METLKRKRLEALGWKSGTVAEFLGLTSEEANFVESQVLLRKDQRERLQHRLGVSFERIAEFCQGHLIKELAVFGSVLTDDFKPESDIDFLVSVLPEVSISLNYLESLETGLKKIVNREVDLIFKNNLLRSENWIRKKAILSSAEVIYRI
jgi:predicted nucleotidyltransferase